MDERLSTISEYFKAGIPVLLEKFDENLFANKLIIKANIPTEELIGTLSLESTQILPKWCETLKNNKEQNLVLLIQGIDEVSKEEQIKFVDILQNNKIGSIMLPKVLIAITSSNNQNVSERIKSLVAIA